MIKPASFPSLRTTLALSLFFATSPSFSQSSPSQATIQVDATHVENHISPRMYASFVEMMAQDVKWGMTAEMIHDRSFEEPTDYLGLPAAWRIEPDERNDNGGAITFSQTDAEAYPAKNQATGAVEHSLRVTLTSPDINDTRRGLSQGHLSVVAGQSYSGYLWAKLPAKSAYTGHIEVALEEDETDGQRYASATLEAITPSSGIDWHQYRFTLTPNHTDRFAKLSILFDGTGTLFLDQLSLELADAHDQVRPDSEAMIRTLHPSFIRWPGGNVAQDYHWRWGIGPRDQRPTWINKSWSNAPEPGDLGTDEYLALCHRLGIEPSITVNVDGAGATPAEAAAWVEYVNGPATSKYGTLRAANGHPEPYGVHQWELGNEIFGDWVRGHVSAEQYAQAAARYARAMRAVDPNLRLIAVGTGVFPNSDDWNSAVLRIAGPEIQYLAIHDYTSTSQNAKSPNPRATMMGRAGEFEANYRHIGELAARLAPDRNIKLIVNEWNLFYSVDTLQSMEGAVYAARMMNGFERDGAVVEANSISDLLNGWLGGIIQASRDRVYGSPQFYAVKLYGDHLGTDRLHADVHSPELQPGTPTVDAIATRSSDGSQLFVKLSNADANHPIATHIAIKGFRHTPNAKLMLLDSAKQNQRNTFTDPTAVVPHEQPMECADDCTINLPPDSVAILVLERR